MGTRESIVGAARRLFYTRGFEHTSLADLAEASGVPKGNFYYHFRTKDDVLGAVLAARDADVEQRLQTWQENISTPSARLDRLVSMLTHECDDLVKYGCPVGSLLTELGKGHPVLKRSAQSTMELFVGFAERQLRASGHGRRASRVLALRLLARCQGAVLLAHAYEDPKLLAREIEDVRAWLVGLTEGDRA